MKLDEILQAAGRHKPRKRLGRGDGSGQGCTAGRGHKGYHSRAGSKRNLGFEGGQTPALARTPKRGFSNANFRTSYQIVNVADLDRFEDGQTVDPAVMAEARLIDDPDKPVKVLGKGALERKLTVVATVFSKAAAEKIAQAGGKAETPRA